MMEQLSENNSAQPGQSAEMPDTSLGTILREARESLGLSVADVANQIKFAPRQIEALEADDFKHLPEAAFLRGFIRSYAKILQLDTQGLLAMLPHTKPASLQPQQASVEVLFPGVRSPTRQNVIWFSVAALLVVVVGGFALRNLNSPQKYKVVQVETPLPLPTEEQTTPAPLEPEQVARVAVPALLETAKVRAAIEKPGASVPASKTQAPEPAAQNQAVKTTSKSVTPTAAQTIVVEAKPATPPQVEAPAKAANSATPPDASPQITQLRLEFDKESWTEIRDRDGKIISSQVNPPGSELTIYGRAPFSMLIGHGLSVRLYHQGKQVDLAPYINKYSEVAHVTLQ